MLTAVFVIIVIKLYFKDSLFSITELVCLINWLMWRITVVDDDGDVVRCRWAEDSRQECASVCQSLSSADVTLNQVSSHSHLY